jgi:IclR family transcriptional regulator, acetate operon repressor
MSVTESAGTEGAARVADVLLAFMDGPRSRGVSAIARELDLSKAVVHRILTTLSRRGLLAPDPSTRGYHLGPAAAALGARALRESELRAAAMPVLRELQRATDETTTVSALVPGGRVYLDQIESAREIKMTVELGRRFPLHAGSSSTCILAFLPPDQQDAVLSAPLDRLTSKTVCDPDVLRKRLLDVRRRGVAFSEGERQQGAGSVAAPVFDLDGSVLGAISVCGPVDRVDRSTRERFVPLLTAAADRISRQLGWQGGLPTTLDGHHREHR